MDKRDTKYTDLNTTLSAVGKAVFVNFYYDFKNASLSDHEIECLAWGMVVSWTEQQLNSTRLIEQQYYDAGIKTYSPNETMKNLLELHDGYYKRLKNRLTEYGYKTIDISTFGGNE